jgi:cysteinyl-tRNA synthetase
MRSAPMTLPGDQDSLAAMTPRRPFPLQPKPAPSRRRRRWPSLVLALFALGAIAVLLERTPMPRRPLEARQGPVLASVKAWGYQLQRLRASSIPQEVDLMVVDYSRSGNDTQALSSEDVAALRWRPRAPPRIVLAYMSVGEAESYRSYWRWWWQLAPPSWLGPENKDWRGNFAVRYWEPDWQRVIFEPAASALDRLTQGYLPWRRPYIERILEAGFDGVYLDRVDAFYKWSDEHPSAEDDMVAFVARLSAHSKRRRPGFLVVAQNAEELLERTEYRRVVDGIAKEDLVFGVNGDGTRNADGEVSRSIRLLNRARADGLGVLVVEYLSDPARQAEARARIVPQGFPLLFARRQLNAAPEVPGSARD